MAAFDAFNGWTGHYLSSGLKERAAMLEEGIALAGSRRTALREVIASDPQRALENAVHPVVRQQLPAGVVVRLEERVNETAFFGVYAALPLPGSPCTRSIRREVRTDDGGVYNAFVFGRRETQQTTERSSVLGIAVDDAMAVDARAVRVVAAGEIPNHPNNRTRRRTVQPRDDKGFVQESELRETPAPERPLVETCPVSGVASRAGIMVRTGVGNADVEAFIGFTANGRVAWVTRSIQGNNATELTSNNLAAPRWVRMVRSDQQFTGYHSADGITWTSMGTSGFLNTTTSMLVGLALTDGGTGLATASFSNVSMSFADNAAPTVSAGPDRALRVGETITLAGTRSDDAKPVVPGLVTVAWSKLSGPNPLTIAVPSAAATTAIAGAPGTFVLRLTANDGEAKTYDDMVTTIT